MSELPQELFDKSGKRVEIKEVVLEAKREGALAVSRTIAEQTLTRALHAAAATAGEEFVDNWLRNAYKHRCENKP